MENSSNMNQEKLNKITEQQKDLRNLPNSDLVEILDVLSSEFEITKDNIINLTYYIDNIEMMYNNTLKEYQNRK